MAISTPTFRIVLVTFLLVVLGHEQPVWARPVAINSTTPTITVTGPPAGAVIPANSPITVAWTSNHPQAKPVHVALLGPTSGFTVGTFSGSNTGQHTFTLPDTFACDPQANYRFRAEQAYQSGGSYSISGSSSYFKLACPITFIKQVVNTTGRPLLNSEFRVRVQCEPGSQTIVSISAFGAPRRRVVQVPPGSTWCTVQELPPTTVPSPNCSWLTTYPSGQQRVPGGPPVTIVNTLQCGPASPGGPRP